MLNRWKARYITLESISEKQTATIDCLSKAVAKRDEEIAYYKELLGDKNKEITLLRKAVGGYERQRERLNNVRKDEIPG